MRRAVSQNKRTHLEAQRVVAGLPRSARHEGRCRRWCWHEGRRDDRRGGEGGRGAGRGRRRESRRIHVRQAGVVFSAVVIIAIRTDHDGAAIDRDAPPEVIARDGVVRHVSPEQGKARAPDSLRPGEKWMVDSGGAMVRSKW